MSFLYQTGGTLGLDSPTYIRRQADDDLYAALIEGHFCYVLTSRQTGKSSLQVQVRHQLQNTGLKCSSIDLAGIGSKTITPDQWYYGILKRILKDLNLLEVFDIKGFWRERQELGLLQRLSEFVDEILLKHFTEPIVIFVDEIDSTISLPFSSDDFFAWIRSCYNLRADCPQYQHLTFCLLGVASPNDLIQEKTKTPFNIGRAIYLERFKKEQLTTLVAPLSEQLGNLIEARNEIHKWTGGQPYLTQKLCKIIQKSKIEIEVGAAAEKISQLVHSEIITSWKFKEEQSHLATIRDRLLNDKHPILLLSIYSDVLAQKDKGLLVSGENFSAIVDLLLTGLVVLEHGKLFSYNSIYQAVFSTDWVNQELFPLRPYSVRLAQWLNNESDLYLLTGENLAKADQWASTKKLSNDDYKYLTASQKFDADNLRLKARQTINKAKQRANLFSTAIGASILTSLLIVLLTIVSILSFYHYEKNKNIASLYQKYASCPIEKGRPGEKIGNSCFRNLITSGEVSVFLSSINFQLEQGVKAFREGDYNRAIKLFQYAVDGDRSDPIAQIFLNNAKARQREKSLKLAPLKLAVVPSIDYYEAAAKDMLKGVADAQDEFNHKQGSQSPLLEIVIANDENAPEAARKVAQDLVGNSDILGVIGHHSSESTYEAQKIYEKAQIAVISPASSSSAITGEQFFRTVGGTKKAATEYTKYIKEKLKISKIIVFYKSDSWYSKALKEDFKREFEINGGEVLKAIDTNSDSFDIETEVDEATDDNEKKAALIITNVQTNSIAIAINKSNKKIPANRKLTLLGAMSLTEVETLEKGGKELDGFTLVRPCFPKSTYMTKQAQKWNLPELNWRTATSYDATKAFAKAITLSKNKTRAEILSQLQSPSFSLSKEETSGFGLQWDLSDRSNKEMKYCVVRVEYPVENPEVIKKYYPKFVEIPNDINSTPVKQK
jgi:ABC-type branched-subunit amino acid transport system substrate-binding protein